MIEPIKNGDATNNDTAIVNMIGSEFT